MVHGNLSVGGLGDSRCAREKCACRLADRDLDIDVDGGSTLSVKLDVNILDRVQHHNHEDAALGPVLLQPLLHFVDLEERL